jgi:hypothetical protein
MSRLKIEGINTQGLMILQDVQYGQNKWRLTGRIALFDAAPDASRIT